MISVMRAFWLTIKEVVEVVAIALVTVFIIRGFLVQPFLVSGASMEPTFQDGNYLLIDELTYRFREPERGEVVVFRYPRDPKVFYIKRIVGLPGEEVAVLGGKVYVNGKELQEAYLAEVTGGSASVRLGESEYFVMGDNRSHSFDSRNWGPVTRDDIIGITRLRVLPFQQFGIVEYAK